MKSYNGLYDAMMQHDEIIAAIKASAKGKTKRSAVKRALANIDAKADEIAAKIPTWMPPPHSRVVCQEGAHKKQRTIEKPHWDCEQIIHHMLAEQLKKILIPRTYRYSCGVMKGRGALFAARTMKRWVDSYHGRKLYVAELDVRQNYDSVDLNILKDMLSSAIRDKRYLDVLFRVIDNSGPGLPKGFYTSPWLASFYIMPLDDYILQQLRPDHYLRFVDNLYLFSRNKRALHRMVDSIGAFLRMQLHMELNARWQVFRFEHGNRGRAIDALGYVIHCKRVTLRKSILKRSRAKVLRMKRKRRCRRIDAASVLAYKGWYDHTDTYGYFQRWIKPNVSIRYCRRRLSALARKENHDKLAYCA